MRLSPLLLVGLLSAAIPSQVSLQAEADAARIAWDGGDYVAALRGFSRLLNAPEGEQFFEEIALLTGELYRVEEVAADGRSIQISPNGRFAAYQAGAGGSRLTHVIRLDQPREVAMVRAAGFAFSPTEDCAAFLAPGDDGNEIVLLDLASGQQTEVDRAGLLVMDLAYAPEGRSLYVVTGPDASQIYVLERRDPGGFSAPSQVTSGDGYKSNPIPVPGGEKIVYTSSNRRPFAGGRRGRGRGRGTTSGGSLVILDLHTGATDSIAGSNPVVSADGSTLAYSATRDGRNTVLGVELSGAPEVVIVATENRLGAYALSPNGQQLVYQMMPHDDWELFLAPTTGGESVRLTREIQHDLNPRFLDNDTVLALMGESRHRRSYLYDVSTLQRTRLFHNNTVRTIAPEYEWTASADGSRVLIVSERDGDTVSPERAVYLVDLTRKITVAELRDRIRTSLEAELDLRARGEQMFAPVADAVRLVTETVSIGRIYGYQKSLYDFDSKNISQPGNAKAREYIFETFESFGYEAQLQWFTPRGRNRGGARGRGRGGRGGAGPGSGGANQTANVLAILPGTENPELIYILSSHFDSTSRGPGADDNTSGTSVTMEAARVLARHPQAATIIFAAFTGEESGLLGSREWVRQAVEADLHVLGALNNDMLGWSNNHQLDNTIRYSNKGIRDVQHAAAFLFTKLITYDALYYKSTDAAAYYDAYGDIVAGIGSYPVLGNPHYHQPTDHLETMNHELITETCRTTVASLMLLASSPSRLTDLSLSGFSNGQASITWTPSPENSVVSYQVVYGPPNNPTQHSLTVTGPRAVLPSATADSRVAVRATNSRGLHGWDWAYLSLTR